jgi:gluconate 2-dehydrogenase gamma chain
MSNKFRGNRAAVHTNLASVKTSRRRFLAASPVAWVAARWPEIVAAQEHARHAAASIEPPKFEYLDAASAREIEAAAEQILPAGATAGARQAGVVYFIDRALATFERAARPTYSRGLRTLARRAAAMSQGKRFSELPEAQQIKVLEQIETSDFFQTLRYHTIVGFLANPQYRGNRAGAGWRAIGFEDEASFEPPFGYYDRNPGERE